MIRHVTVYADESMFAGWPANHGAWQWGDEFLVGFLRGPYAPEKLRTHRIREPFQKVQARSLDGGETWSVEDPNVDFEGAHSGRPPQFDLRQTAIRVCGYYDHGGEACREGAFYRSSDRGGSWEGPYLFEGLPKLGELCSARTAVLDGRYLLMTFRSAASENDVVYCVRHDGGQFSVRSVVSTQDRPALMPQGVAVDGRLLVAVRRMRPDYGIEVYASDDDAATWHPLSRAGETGGHNGNPPAMTVSRGIVYCAYANRDKGMIMLSRSEDRGATWREEVIRRAPKGGKSDIGYPQLFARSDGRVVCVYYWSEPKGQPQHIEAAIV